MVIYKNKPLRSLIRFADKPEERISLEDFKSFLLDSQKVKVLWLINTYYCFLFLFLPQFVLFNPSVLFVHQGAVGHGQQQGSGVYV